ncbi:MAG: cobyric acid synthase [Acidimicrobiales bacterium]
MDVPATHIVPSDVRRLPLSGMPPGKAGVMILGTSSNAGKSTIVTGLCRLLSDAGLKVAPFKAQNMSLESYVTADGGEISRAQAAQAVAARCEPVVNMNPVLLKPVDGSLSQVIVLGKPVGIMSYRDYQQQSGRMMEIVRESLHSLWRQYDVVICEGAGSPAEINLLEYDVVNLPLAREYGMPSLLVADIERGGMFASVYGTWAILPPDLSALIKGYAVNKMRGDHEVLYPGITTIEQKTGIPCIGILPFMDGIDIDAEDSLSRSIASISPDQLATQDEHSDGADWGRSSPVVEGHSVRSGMAPSSHERKSHGTIADSTTSKIPRPPSAVLDIVVIEFPHLANATDIDPIKLESNVSVRFVAHHSQLGTPDLVVLPGSRNTAGDLLWMRSSGLADALHDSRERDDSFTILGICAGYQMMGKYVDDMVESRVGRIDALGMLPIITVMAEEKIVRRRAGIWNAGYEFGDISTQVPSMPDAPGAPSMPGVSGYEIHHGRLSYTDHAGCGAPWFALDDTWGSEYEGYVNESGTVFGTSIHGLMEDTLTRTLLLAGCARRRSKSWMPSFVSYGAYRESRIDAIATSLREHVDLALLEKLTGVMWQ